MKKYGWLFCVLLAGWISFDARRVSAADAPSIVVVDTSKEPVAEGPYDSTWDSLKQYECPEWFQDVKFGIWAHWGPQCEPERGDWYAREMYSQGNWKYNFHVEKYGHPSEFGFKDVIHEWKAEKWDPKRLMALYKRAGAQYFFAMANHHDNFDMWDSPYQPWNAVNLGPEKDIIAGWAEAARAEGLRFGMSFHAAHAWSWYETSQASDKTGPKAGVPYDGKLTKADGEGKWWEGYDPQDLYEQRHEPASGFENLGSIHGRWNWGHGVTQPDQAYCDKFYNRTVQAIGKYKPDLVYFDDTALPLWPASDAGLKIAAYLYNQSASRNGGKNQAVLFGKILNDEQKDCLSWDVERGVCTDIQADPWQTDTCLGSWHYDVGIYENNRYKDAKTVIQMLVDIVSKNGNLLLSVPVRADGTIDDKEELVLEGIASWMDVNKECIFGTRPWKIFGEGPALEQVAELSAQGFNEGRGKAMTAQDIRFTTKDDVLYVIAMGFPTKPLSIKALGSKSEYLKEEIAGINVLGSTEAVEWEQGGEGLVIKPLNKKVCEEATVFRIVFE